MVNPLLSCSAPVDPATGTEAPLPDFEKIEAGHFLPAIAGLTEDNRKAIDQLLDDNGNNPRWDSLMHPIETLNDKLEQAWSCISHLNGVLNSPDVRDAHAQCQPLLTEYSTWVGQHSGLHGACTKIKNGDQYNHLDKAQKQALDHLLRDFRLAGIELDAAGQKRYSQIKKRLAELGTAFSNNVLDATEGWSKLIEDAGLLAGVPPSYLEAAQQRAADKGLQGYLVSLDMPSYLPLMQYCSNRSLRQEVYRAYVVRASELEQAPANGDAGGTRDNSAVMEEILELRHELSQLLGFENYAELSLASKMAGSPAEVMQFLQDLATQTRDIARTEYRELEQFAASELAIDELQAWDVPFASEALRLSRYDISQEALRPYFPADTVIEGMFAVVKRLYGIDIVAAGPVSSWHSDIRFYEISRDGQVLARFYLDLFAREGKRGGAWMADCRGRRRLDDGQLQLPVAFLVCNFSPPTGDKPSLLTHNEVTTLFHEFGHGLHHMMTRVECAAVAGINGVPWDAVELPSQFMENWCWQAEALAMISGHYESGEALPEELLQKMLAAKNFHSALQMVRQLEFALFDLTIHCEYGSASWQGIQAALDKVRKSTAAYAVPEYNRFQHGFSHIFAGGYAAGYYSYKWAEVLSADVFSLFEENGIFDRATGQQFIQSVLEQGGSEDPAVLFRRFRGREPTTEALLRHAGIANSSSGSNS